MNHRHLIGILLGVAQTLAFVCASGAQDSVRAVDTYNAASGMLARGLDDLAADEYERFLQAFPGHELGDQARYGLGVAHSRLGRHAEAIDALEPLLSRDRFQFVVEATVLTARSMLALDRADEAARVLSRVLRRHGEHSLSGQAGALRVEAFYRAREYDDAIDAFEEHESLLSGSAAERAGYFAALSEYSRGELRSAVMRFGRLESGNSSIAASSRLMLARTLQQLGDLDAARAAYRSAIGREGNEQAVDARLGLAQVLIDLQRLDEAKSELDAIRSDQLSEDARWLVDLEQGRLAVLRGDARQSGASRALARIASQGPESIRDNASYWLARAQAADGQHDEASLTLVRALNDYPESALRHEMMYQLGLALGSDNKHQEACQVLSELARECQGELLAGEALLAAASIAQRAGDLALAERLSQQASGDLTGEAAIDAAFLGAEAAYQRGDYSASARAFSRLLSELPNDHERAHTVRYRLGLSQKQLGQDDDSRRTLEALFANGVTDERFRPGLLALGDLAFAAQDWDEAVRWLEMYVKLGAEAPSWDSAALRLGLAHSNAGNRRSAQVAFERLTNEQPGSAQVPRAWYEIGMIAVSLDEPSRAAEAFEAATRAADSEIAHHAFQQLGVLASKRGDHGYAAACFENAAQLAPAGESARSVLNEARAYLAAQAYSKAADALIRLEPGSLDRDIAAERSGLLTLAYARQGQHDQAVASSEPIAQRQELLDSLDASTASSVLYERGRSLRSLKRDGDAERAFALLCERFPASALIPSAMLERSAIAAAGERYDEAAEFCNQILRKSDGLSGQIREQATYRLGVCARALGDDQAAARVLIDLARRTPPDALSASAALIAGESFAKSGNLGRAIEMLEIAVETGDDATVSVALLRLGEAQIGLQYWPRAEETYSRFLSAYSSDPRAYLALFGRAWSLENQSRHDAAIKGYREVIAGHDGETAARAQFQIGECLYAQKKYEDAVRELLRVDLVYAYPQWSAGALFEAGRCFEELDRPADARAQFEQVIERFGDTQWAELAQRRLSRSNQSSMQQGG